MRSHLYTLPTCVHLLPAGDRVRRTRRSCWLHVGCRFLGIDIALPSSLHTLLLWRFFVCWLMACFRQLMLSSPVWLCVSFSCLSHLLPARYGFNANVVLLLDQNAIAIFLVFFLIRGMFRKRMVRDTGDRSETPKKVCSPPDDPNRWG